jgi:hypothetical protein
MKGETEMTMPNWCNAMNMWCCEMDDEDFEMAGCDGQCNEGDECEECDIPDGADCDIEQ